MTPPRTALVVGGGVAGLAAALRLHETGVRVTLLEAADRLGGRASSFTDPVTGATIDQGQHVVLGACTNLLDFYRRLGVADRIQWHDRLYFAGRDGRIDCLEPSPLPAPLHLVPSLARFCCLDWRDKLELAAGARAVLGADRDDPALHRVTFFDWLVAQGQPRALVERFWNTIVRSACNADARQVAADVALQVFQQGFMENRHASRLGVPGVPLVDLYAPMTGRVAELRTGARVVSVNVDRSSDPPRIERVRLSSGESLRADVVILALPFTQYPQLFDADAMTLDPRLSQAAPLAFNPILNVHVFYDEPVTALPHVALLDADLDWIFAHDAGRRLVLVRSAANDWASVDHEAIVARALDTLSRSLPAARDRPPRHVRVIKDRRAAFIPAPGSHRHRPPSAGPIANLFLAGDFTATGWPSTMESAVRSGYQAAAAAFGLSISAFLQPDLPKSWTYQILRPISGI